MQIIAREVELQTMRRSAPKNTNSNTSKSTQPFQKPKPQNHLQKLNTKGVASKARTKDLVRIEFICFLFFRSLLCLIATWISNEEKYIHKSWNMLMTESNKKLKTFQFALEILNFNFVR